MLGEVLEEQYEKLDAHEEVKKSIAALGENNTFTVTTGHQLNIFTGPLYFIYKLITTINLARHLQEQYPDFNVIPVYWMASEDHDFEEINHINLFGKTIKWETDQTGPVGSFHLDDFRKVLEQLPESAPVFEKAYTHSATLSDAVRDYVNALFGEYGLVTIDADDHRLKSIFKPVIKDDLLNHRANDLAGKASEQLSKLGYKSQVYPRTINFFYMKEGIRERIVKDGDYFLVKNTALKFKTDEILKLVEETPEVFSPNVVLRPLYQEYILPNICYIGGPAEMAYWLQLKGIFDQYETHFPALLPRNFALIINKGLYKKVDKLDLDPEMLFRPFNDLKTWYLKRHTENEIDISKEIDQISNHFECIKRKTVEVDKSLEGFVAAEASKTMKSLENITKRIQKSEEKNQEIAINQLKNIIEKLFPENSLQERTDNFLNFYINNSNFISDLQQHFDPLDFCFNIICYDD